MDVVLQTRGFFNTESREIENRIAEQDYKLFLPSSRGGKLVLFDSWMRYGHEMPEQVVQL